MTIKDQIKCLLQCEIEAYATKKRTDEFLYAYVLTDDKLYDVTLFPDGSGKVFAEYDRQKLSDRLINKIFKNKGAASYE